MPDPIKPTDLAGLIANRVMMPGEDTSEHAVMSSATTAGRIYAILGVAIASIPQVIDWLSATPVAGTKTGGIVLACLGALMAVLGIVKETKAKVEYIQGRSLVKAAAMRELDVAPAAPALPAPATPPPAI